MAAQVKVEQKSQVSRFNWWTTWVVQVAFITAVVGGGMLAFSSGGNPTNTLGGYISAGVALIGAIVVAVALGLWYKYISIRTPTWFNVAHTLATAVSLAIIAGAAMGLIGVQQSPDLSLWRTGAVIAAVAGFVALLASFVGFYLVNKKSP
jgi:hypothetical protein